MTKHFKRSLGVLILLLTIPTLLFLFTRPVDVSFATCFWLGQIFNLFILIVGGFVAFIMWCFK